MATHTSWELYKNLFCTPPPQLPPKTNNNNMDGQAATTDSVTAEFRKPEPDDRAEVKNVEYAGDLSPKDEDAPSNLPDGGGPEAVMVSYGRNGVLGLVGNSYVLGAASLASLGGFSFGYDQGVISVVNVMPQFHDSFPETRTAFGKSFMTAMLELGAFLGCLFMPALTDRISRKWALTVVVVIFNVGAIMQTAAPSYGVLVAGRTIGGIGVGTLAMGAPIYISEISPPNLRGTLLALESIAIVGGIVISFWIAYATRSIPGEGAFRLPFGLQMVGSTLLGIGIHLFPYSPRWLALVGREEQCLQALSKVRQLPPSEPRVQAEYRSILTEVRFQKSIQQRNHPGASGIRLEVLQWLDLLKPKAWRRTVVAVGIGFFGQFSGINAFIYYAPTLFTSLGQGPEMALILSGVMNVLQLVGILIFFVLVDYVGRRPLAICGAIGGTTAWGLMAILSGLYSQDWQATPAAGWAAAAMAFLFVMIYGATYSCLEFLLPAEVYTSSHRAKGVALSASVLWICNFIVGVATPPLLDSIGFGTYIFYASFCAMAFVWAYLFVPETRGKTLEEMDLVFQDTAAQEEKQFFQSQIHMLEAPVGV